jgi:ribosomal protein S18 acetylase RimI-like enzyme
MVMISPLTEDAAKILAEFDALCFDAEGMSEEEWAKVLESNAYACKAVEGGKIVGVAVAKYAAGIAYLYSSAVLPEFRGQNLGCWMVNDRLQFLETVASKVQAHTRIENFASQRMLKKCGFLAIQYVTDFYGDLEDAILWERTLL